MLKHLDLFSGIGGFALACQWAGIETIGFVEIDKYCQKVLRKHWPNVPIVEDIRDVTAIKEVMANPERERVRRGSNRGATIREADRLEQGCAIAVAEDNNGQQCDPAVLITAGFPCQPFSVAGKREGTGDDRYLWPETLAVIEAIKPEWVLLENVTGIINLALNTVLSDLEGAGYATETLVIPACAVNAWHRRDRIWIIAFLDNSKCTGYLEQPSHIAAIKGSNGETDRLSEQAGQDDANPKRERLEGAVAKGSLCAAGQPVQFYQAVADPTDGRTQRSGAQCYVRGLENEVLRSRWDPDYWAVEPKLGRVAHGIPNRVDRLKCLGNAIVPQVAYEIIKVVKEVHGK